MYELAPLIYDLALMLGLAGIVVLLFQRIKQPVVLGYLVAGMIVGPYTPPHALVNDVENIQILSELGVIFLMFSLGLEFSFQKLTRVGMPAAITGSVEVILMIFLGYGIGKALGWPHYDALFLGAALSISSTTIIVKAIDELNLRTKRFAELIFAILIVEDLLAILLLVALSTIVNTQDVFSFDLVTAAVRLLVIVSSWFLFGYFLIVPFFKLIANYISQETLTIISVALCLLLVCVAANLHYSTPLGAFIMGSILAETPLIHRIAEAIRPLRDIFAAVFFISVGMLIDPLMIVQHWQVVVLISALTIIGKILTTSVGALITGKSFDRAVRTGFSMAQIGEFSFIIITLGLSLEAIDTKIYPIIVAVSGITTFTTPYLIRFSGLLSQKTDLHLPTRVKYLQQTYAAWIRQGASKGTQSVLGAMTTRVLFNGVLVAIIFSSIHIAIFHRYALFSEHELLPTISFLLLSLAMTSPFIWGMLFAYRVIPQQNSSPYIKTIIAIVWLITFVEIMLLSIVYFHTWQSILLFIIVSAALFVFAFRHLESSYRWLEQRLVSNINLATDPEAMYVELAPWDAQLTVIELAADSLLIGKSIANFAQELLSHVNVIAICRDKEIIFTQVTTEIIAATDKLIILGSETHIAEFSAQIKINPHYKQQGEYLAHFTLQPLMINAQHEFCGKTIAAVDLISGKIVGLERYGQRILNPSADTVLQSHDLLLLVTAARN